MKVICHNCAQASSVAGTPTAAAIADIVGAVMVQAAVSMVLFAAIGHLNHFLQGAAGGI